MFLSIDAQIADMAALWPNFCVVARKANTAAWEGDLRPLLQTFRTRILYRAPLAVETLDIRTLQPQVSILSPRLRPRPGDAEGSLPHVYYTQDDDVILCMLDPDAGDWSPADSVARTTVPWSIEWLAAYEGWRATGRWTASGRHVEAGLRYV